MRARMGRQNCAARLPWSAAAGALGILTATLLSLAATSGAAPPPSSPTTTLRLKLLSVKDPGVGGDEAFHMLIPAEWKSDGGVVWHPDWSNLATTSMRIWNPNGSEALDILPTSPFVWTQGGIAFFPTGSRYLGNEVRPVLGPEAFVEQIALPRYRKSLKQPRVTDRTELPDVAQAVAAAVQEAGVNKTVKAIKVRLEYEERGKPMQEDIYCVLVYSTASMLPGTTFWGPERLVSFRAEKGKLDGLASLLQTMAASVKINLVWFNKYQQVVRMWRQNQMQAIRNAGELSRYIARTNDEISAMNRQAYENRQAAYDRINERFSRHIRGVESYDDRFKGHPVELPSGYNEAWMSPSGEYILSNDPNFNPNVGSTQSWERMKQRQ